MREISFLNNKNYINIDENNLLTYVIEQNEVLFNVEKHIRLEFVGDERYFYLMDNKEPKDISSFCEVLSDIFVLDFNSKKNLNYLYKILNNLYKVQIKEQLKDVEINIKKLIGEISMDFELELTSSKPIEAIDLFKISDLKFNDEEENPINRIINYMKLVYEIRGVSIFFTFRLHEYFSKTDLETIIKEISLMKIAVINIEHGRNFDKISNEKVTIYDKDLCLIY